MPIVDLGKTTLRELNHALHPCTAQAGSNETAWEVINPKGSHAVAVGIDAPITRRCARQRRLLLRRHEQPGAPSPCMVRPAPASART